MALPAWFRISTWQARKQRRGWQEVWDAELGTAWAMRELLLARGIELSEGFLTSPTRPRSPNCWKAPLRRRWLAEANGIFSCISVVAGFGELNPSEDTGNSFVAGSWLAAPVFFASLHS